MSSTMTARPPRNGVDVPKLFATIDAVKAQPAAAQFRFRAVNRWVSGTHSRTTIHGFYGTGQELEHRQAHVVEADHPEVLVGSDAAPTPVEHILHGLAACLTAGIGNVASARGIELREVESQWRATSTCVACSASPTRSATATRGSARASGSSATPATSELRAVVEQSRARSAVFDIVTNGVPVEIDVRTADDRVAAGQDAAGRHPNGRRRAVEDHHDVIVVGARVAGAATALLLARRATTCSSSTGPVAAATPCRPTRSCVPRSANSSAGGWLDRLVAAGTPARIRVVVPLRRRHALRIDLDDRRLYAPRRTVIDAILVDAAERSGARFAFGVSVEDVLRDPSGAGVRGGPGEAPGGTRPRARMVVGADGAGVTYRRVVDSARTAAHGRQRSVYGYWAVSRPGVLSGASARHQRRPIPTNDGEDLRVRRCPRRPVRDRAPTLTSIPAGCCRSRPELAERVEAGARVGGSGAFRGLPGFLRRPFGPGWALVGDAGYYKDPPPRTG